MARNDARKSARRAASKSRSGGGGGKAAGNKAARRAGAKSKGVRMVGSSWSPTKSSQGRVANAGGST